MELVSAIVAMVWGMMKALGNFWWIILFLVVVWIIKEFLATRYELDDEDAIPIKPKPTKEAEKLYEALRARGIECELEVWDGYKHIDISIPKAKLDIEVDGPQHYTDPKQIEADIYRSHYSSRDGYDTLHIPNDQIKKNLMKITDAILRATEKRNQDI